MNSIEIQKEIDSKKGTITEDKLYLKKTDFVDHKVLRALIDVVKTVATSGQCSGEVQQKLENAVAVIDSNQHALDTRLSTIAQINDLEEELVVLDEMKQEALEAEAAEAKAHEQY